MNPLKTAADPEVTAAMQCVNYLCCIILCKILCCVNVSRNCGFSFSVFLMLPTVLSLFYTQTVK